jgi:hypothetical protein
MLQVSLIELSGHDERRVGRIAPLLGIASPRPAMALDKMRQPLDISRQPS